MAVSAKTKAAVIAALLAGETVSDVSKSYSVPKATVSRWKSEMPKDDLVQIGTARRQTLTELIETAFATFLSAEMKVAEDFLDEAWRKSLSLEQQLSIANHCGQRARAIVETAEKFFGKPPEPEPILELPAVDFASDLDVQAETPAIDSDGVG